LQEFLRARLKQEADLISTLPEGERALSVQQALERFHVDTTGLTRLQQYDIAMAQIKGRSERYNRTLLLVGFLAVVLTGVTVFAIFSNPNGSNTTSQVGSQGGSQNLPLVESSFNIPEQKDSFGGDLIVEASEGSMPHRVSIVISSPSSGQLGGWTTSRGNELGQGDKREFQYKGKTYYVFVRVLKLNGEVTIDIGEQQP
jgi:hypothetical protein